LVALVDWELELEVMAVLALVETHKHHHLEVIALLHRLVAKVMSTSTVAVAAVLAWVMVAKVEALGLAVALVLVFRQIRVQVAAVAKGQGLVDQVAMVGMVAQDSSWLFGLVQHLDNLIFNSRPIE
jgi:hypothetical protein